MGNPNFSITLVLATLAQLSLSMIMEHNLLLIRHRVWKIFSLWVSSKGFWIVPNIHLTTNKSPSQGISHSSSLAVFEEEGELALDDWELWSLTTIPFLTIIVLLLGQSAPMCPKPKHLKHFLLEVLVGDLGVEGSSFECLWCGVVSFEKLEGESWFRNFFLPFQDDL